MLNRVNSILQQNCFLSSGKTLLVGVSGGPDSMCLLDVLVQLGYPLVVAHLNHGLRPESQSDAEFVEQIAKRAGLPVVIGKEDVSSYACIHSLSIEEAARNLRYRFLFQQAELVQAQAVVVAHNADDQVETVLMHFLRGAGMAGLRGMQYLTLPSPWCDHIPLVRPLLEIWREEILAYLKDRKINSIHDQTNLDTSIFRNRLRHELIPYLADFNPGIRRVIWRMAQVLSADYDVIEANLDAAWEECLVEQGQGYVSFRAPALFIQPEGIKRHLMRRGISWLLPGLRDIDSSTVERALGFIEHSTRSRRLDLAAGMYLLREADLLWLASWQADLPVSDWPQLAADDGCSEGLFLPAPGSVCLVDDWQIHAESLVLDETIEKPALGNPDPFQIWIDAAQLHMPLTVRCRQPGDRFKPLGMAGKTMKVSDFMINMKIPARARANWPLVFSADTLVWIPGMRMAHACQISNSTQQVVHLRMLRNTPEPDYSSRQ
jgi:tRNA(Ile)-lysidine synthase